MKQVLAQSSGIVLTKVITPDKHSHVYTVTAPGRPIPDKSFPPDAEKEALEYYEQCVATLASITT